MSAAQVITKLSKLKKKVIWFLFFFIVFFEGRRENTGQISNLSKQLDDYEKFIVQLFLYLLRNVIDLQH